MRLATSYENPGRLGLICRLCLVLNQQFSQQTPAQPMLSSKQIWLRWHPFFLDLLQENSPIMRPICHRNSAKHLNFLGWDCCSLFWVNHVMFSKYFFQWSATIWCIPDSWYQSGTWYGIISKKLAQNCHGDLATKDIWCQVLSSFWGDHNYI